MAKNTKIDILLSARKLFNENGYSSVSMRNIADETGISVGNLTYHFKKKESLIEEVIRYKHRDYQKIKAPQNLIALNNLFIEILNIRRDNAYYYNHYFQLSLISYDIYIMQMQSFNDLKSALKEGLSQLFEQGLIVESPLGNHIDDLVEMIISILIYRPVNAPTFDEIDNSGVLLNCLWNNLYMHLTDKGKKCFNNEILNKKKLEMRCEG